VVAAAAELVYKLMKKAGSVLVTALEPLDLIVTRRMPHKLINIKKNTAHALHKVLKQRSGICARVFLPL